MLSAVFLHQQLCFTVFTQGIAYRVHQRIRMFRLLEFVATHAEMAFLQPQSRAGKSFLAQVFFQYRDVHPFKPHRDDATQPSGVMIGRSKYLAFRHGVRPAEDPAGNGVHVPHDALVHGAGSRVRVAFFLPPGVIQRRAAKGIPMRSIHPDVEQARAAQARDTEELRESALVPQDKFRWGPEIQVYGNKVNITSWKEKLGVIIESKEIAGALEAIFDLSYEAAKNYGKATALSEEERKKFG